ncbi:MAG: T9SS type A sorting domain-containing protein, partial [Muribaculaceae bacterium]|nr:T9SS type A sorting domain-containing protein [Muribaculaceae bacterium]
TDYAIARIDGSTQAFPLKFRAVGNGEYTVSVSGDMSEMGYLHLIDRATGSDIDLLSQPTYTFTNTRNQSSTQRFTVKLSPNADEEGNGIFAYQNGDRIVVEGTGTLQVYDVLGRQLFTHEMSSQLSIPSSQFPSTGIYILRLGEKSQKLVIK